MTRPTTTTDVTRWLHEVAKGSNEPINTAIAESENASELAHRLQKATEGGS